MATVNCLVTDIVQNIFLCAQWRKKTHTGFEQEEGEFSVLGELSLKVCSYKRTGR